MNHFSPVAVKIYISLSLSYLELLTYQMCVLMSVIEFGKFSVTISSNVCSASYSFLSFEESHFEHVGKFDGGPCLLSSVIFLDILSSVIQTGSFQLTYLQVH